MEEATPRGIIRGVLTTASVRKSARSLRQRKTPREANEQDTPANPPSEREVASRLLTRTRSSSKRKVAPAVIATPSDSTTPKTLIAGFLQTADVAKSTSKGKRQKVQDTHTAKPQSMTSNVKEAQDDTPRTLIQNYLREAITESPEEVVVSHATGVDQEEDSTEETGTEDEDRLVTNSSSIAHSDTEMKSNVPPEASFTSHQEAHDSVDVSSQGDKSTSASYEHTLDFGSNAAEDEFASQPFMVTQSLQTESIEKHSTQTSSRWRDLVTPVLPLDVSSTVGQVSQSTDVAHQRSVVGRTQLKTKPPTGKTRTKISKSPGPRMPSTLVRSIFQHFSKAKLSKEALQAVENGSNLFFKQASSDLMAFCQHAHRSTIETGDVELLMKRQGFITDSQSLDALVEKFLPLEYRQEVIPMAQAGNAVILK